MIISYQETVVKTILVCFVGTYFLCQRNETI